MWLFYSLLAAISWGIGQIFVKRGLKDISSLFNTALSTFFGFLIFMPFSLSHGVRFEQFFQIAPIATVIATLFLTYYYAIGRGQLALTGTLVGTYPIVTVILSLIFLHETPSIYQKMAIMLVIIGAVLVATPNKLEKVKLGTWIWWVIFAIFSIGLADFLIKVLLNQYDLYTYLFTFGLCSMFVTILLVIFDKKGRKLPKFNLKYYLPTLIGVAMIEIGFFMYNLAVQNGFVSLVTPVSGIYVAITAVLAWIILKEKINRVQFIGIALSALGVVLVGIT